MREVNPFSLTCLCGLDFHRGKHGELVVGEKETKLKSQNGLRTSVSKHRVPFSQPTLHDVQTAGRPFINQSSGRLLFFSLAKEAWVQLLVLVSCADRVIVSPLCSDRFFPGYSGFQLFPETDHYLI